MISLDSLDSFTANSCITNEALDNESEFNNKTKQCYVYITSHVIIIKLTTTHIYTTIKECRHVIIIKLTTTHIYTTIKECRLFSTSNATMMGMVITITYF